VYQRIRQATDNSGRPLLHIGGNDEEVLFGKPIYVSPSLPVVGGSLALNSVLLFGDLQQYHVRMSKPLMTRNIQSATKGIEFGQALYSCRARVDAVYIDASSGVSPSIIAATVTA
jgi:HK97 family phage major capsid protein